MFGWNFFLIRDKDGNINAFHNICRHRGHPVTTKATGSSTVLACRFHGWSYLPNGDLHKAREYYNLPDFNPKQHGLFKIHTHVTAQGFIFVNFDARETPAVSFEEQFGEDFEPMPRSGPGNEVGDEFALFSWDGWEYDREFSCSPMDRSVHEMFIVIALSTTVHANGESQIPGTRPWLERSSTGRRLWMDFRFVFLYLRLPTPQLVNVLQECYHCQTGHPTTLPKDFALDQYYLRQGTGASRHFLPPKKEGLSEAYISELPFCLL